MIFGLRLLRLYQAYLNSLMPLSICHLPTLEVYFIHVLAQVLHTWQLFLVRFHFKMRILITPGHHLNPLNKRRSPYNRQKLNINFCVLQVILQDGNNLLIQRLSSLHFPKLYKRNKHVTVLVTIARLASIRAFLEQSVPLIDLLDMPLQLLLGYQPLLLQFQLAPSILNVFLSFRCNSCQILDLHGLNLPVVNRALDRAHDLDTECPGANCVSDDSLGLLHLHLRISNFKRTLAL